MNLKLRSCGELWQPPLRMLAKVGRRGIKQPTKYLKVEQAEICHLLPNVVEKSCLLAQNQDLLSKLAQFWSLKEEFGMATKFNRAKLARMRSHISNALTTSPPKLNLDVRRYLILSSAPRFAWTSTIAYSILEWTWSTMQFSCWRIILNLGPVRPGVFCSRTHSIAYET